MQNKDETNYGFWAVVLIIWLVFMCGALRWFLSPEPITPTPAPPTATGTAVIEPTPTKRATSTPTHTAQPLTLTPSPVPTNTPTLQPTDTATPAPTETAVLPTSTPSPEIVATRQIERGGTYWQYAWDFYGDPACWWGLRQLNVWHERHLPIGGIMRFTAVCRVHPGG